VNLSLATSIHLDHAATPVDVDGHCAPRMQTFVPVGLLSLKATLDRDIAGCETRVTEVNGVIASGGITTDGDFYRHLAELLVRPGDDIIGLMTDADSLHHTVALTRHIKERRPDVLVCLGGPGSSPLGRELLQRFTSIDWVVAGEGEQTLAELVDALIRGRNPAGIAGLYARSPDGFQFIPRPVIDDLDTLPIPAFDAYDMASDAPVYLDVGRGCPFKCSFCATAPFWQRKYRMKSIPRILCELAILRSYGRAHVAFSHDIFTFDRDWVARFCSELSAKRWGMTWSCSTRTDQIDAELLHAMADAGCIEIYYGIEAGTAEQQKSINKRLSLHRSREVIRATVAAGIRPVTGFIVGHPNESPASFCGTLEFFMDALAMGVARAHLFVLCPFHEAPMYASMPQIADRWAEYRDLVLEGRAGEHCERLQAEHPDVFLARRRYETPGIDSRWVDAAEGLSCHLVTLRSLWRLLLPHYSTVLDWYRRWVAWISAHNARNRPSSPLRHQGDANDLLAFVDAEIERLELHGAPIHTMAAYERAKLTAMTLSLPRGQALPRLPARGKVWLRMDFIARCFGHDIGCLLDGAIDPGPGQSWGLFVRLDDGRIRTMRVSERILEVLEVLRQPRIVEEICVDPLLSAGENRILSQQIIGRLAAHDFIGGDVS